MLDLKNRFHIGLFLVSMVSTTVSSHFSENSIVGYNEFLMETQQAESCPRSGARELCQSFQVGSRDVHVCPDNGDGCDIEPCFYSASCICSDRMLQSPLLKCNSTINVFIEGKSVKLTGYIFQTPGLNVPDESCFMTEPSIDSCTENCGDVCIIEADIVCRNNTKSGDLTSCNAEGCECVDDRWLQPDCCQCDTNNYFLPNCSRFCRGNCGRFAPDTIGGCISCHQEGFEPPSCCNCTADRILIDGICKCRNSTNFETDGTCRAGYAPEDCCSCAPGYTRNETGECSNNRECSREQNIYFLMDGSKGNSDFPSLLLAVQMLVAAFNPQPNQSGTKASVVLFGDGSMYAPSVISTIADDCEDINSTLIELQNEFQVCRNTKNDQRVQYKKREGFESLCAGSSNAASGLNAINKTIASSSSVSSALVIMTDGQLSELNDPKDRIEAINALKDENLNLMTMIAAGIKSDTIGRGATYDNLVNYTRLASGSPRFDGDHVVINYTAIEVGQEIVSKLAESGILCADYATRIKAALAEVKTTPELKDNYIICHNTELLNGRTCKVEYPKCGGLVGINATIIPSMESLSLEDEILAAVEKALERFEE